MTVYSVTQLNKTECTAHEKSLKISHTWQPAFSNIFAYSTVFSKSSKTRILQVTGIISFSFSKLTVNKTKLYKYTIMNREVI